MERDLQLDMYRSLSMIYIVCVIHVLYWLDLGEKHISSILLFEMPIIFFISGAAVKVSKGGRKSFTQMFKNRFKRIVLPYYVYILYSIIFLVVLAILSYYTGRLLVDISKFKWQYLLDWLMMKEGHVIPYSSHLWFLIPYFLISISTPVQLKILSCVSKIPYLLINLILFVLLSNVFVIDRSYYSIGYYVTTFLGYNLFYLLGLFYYRNIRIKYVSLLFFCAVSIFCILTKCEFVVMQSHKFPPDMIFVSYNLIVLLLLCFIFSYVKIPSNKIFSFWNKNGYELFLYQNCIFRSKPVQYSGGVVNTEKG